MRSIFNEVCKIKQKYNLIALVRGRELEWMRGFRGASWGAVGRLEVGAEEERGEKWEGRATKSRTGGEKKESNA